MSYCFFSKVCKKKFKKKKFKKKNEEHKTNFEGAYLCDD